MNKTEVVRLNFDFWVKLDSAQSRSDATSTTECNNSSAAKQTNFTKSALAVLYPPYRMTKQLSELHLSLERVTSDLKPFRRDKSRQQNK